MAVSGKFELVSYTNPTFNFDTDKFEWSMSIKNISGSTLPISDRYEFNHFRGRVGSSISTLHGTTLGATGKLNITSTKANFLVSSTTEYEMYYLEAISDDEVIDINIELVAAFGTLIYDRFDFGSPVDYGSPSNFEVFFAHFGSVAGIADGLVSGSTSVRVVADLPSGTTIYLYKCGNFGSAPVSIGAGVISNSTPGYVTITPSESIVGGEIYIAYAGSVGFATYGGFAALYESSLKSGWKEPSSLFDAVNDETTYEDYLAAGGTPIADYRDAKNTINRAAKAECTVVDFDLEPRFDLKIERDGDDYNVRVINPSSYLGNIRLSWDSGEIVTERTQSFTGVSGTETHTVTVFHETDDTISATRSFEIDNTINSYTAEIWGLHYDLNDDRQLQVYLYSKVAVDVRVVELNGGAWYSTAIEDAKNYLRRKNALVVNMASGLYTLEAKRATETLAEVSCPIKIDW